VTQPDAEEPGPGASDPSGQQPEQPPPSEWPPPPPPAYPPAPPPAPPAGYPPHYPQYPPPYAAHYPPPSAGTNGFAIASLVLGILWIWWLGSILALVFGYVGKNQIDRGGRVQGGRGLAVAGIVLGWIGVAILALLIILAIIGVATTPTDDF
jgi:hypothetical protein